MCFPIYGTLSAFFALINKKIINSAFFALINKKIINCAMTNKMAWNERMSPFKHVHII